MSSTLRCHLTEKSFSTLEVILQRGINTDEAFLRLLRRKLSTAAVVFQDDIDADTATINSLVDYTVDRRMSDSRILTYGGDDALTGMNLPITTLHGLALLGLTAGSGIVIEGTDGTWEDIQLDLVSFQPEADRRERSFQCTTAGTNAHAGAPSAVVSFARSQKSPAKDATEESVDPNDDDPGPRAAQFVNSLKRRL